MNKSNWIYNRTKKPDKEGQYLVVYIRYFVPDHVDDPDHMTDMGIGYYDTKYGWHVPCSNNQVSYWMPLPDYPDAAKRKIEKEQQKFKELGMLEED